MVLSPRRAALLLLLLLPTVTLQPDRTRTISNHDKRNQNPELRSRRHDSASSRRIWTTASNSHYQKIVSNIEHDLGEAGEQDQDQAKAKSHKRKQARTGASPHDQIASETSSSGESEKVDEESNVPTSTPRSHKSSRRRSTTSHPASSATPAEPSSTPGTKKRRRPATTSTTTTLAPLTMSDSLYNHFRPLESGVPQDDITTFFDFGRKLSPVIPTPSSANSIENRSTARRHKPRNHHEERQSNSSDEEDLQEDMDVTVVKKAIERNSVPTTKLQVREKSISALYRKRPAQSQVATTENLITSDSSTDASVGGGKNTVVLKKIRHHQVHEVLPLKTQESVNLRLPSDVENVDIKNVEKKNELSSSGQRSEALKEEHPHSPLTAESSLVKTVIKDIPVEDNVDAKSVNNTTFSDITTSNKSETNSTISKSQTNNSTILSDDKPKETQNSKILSTAVVTSVSVKESVNDSLPLSTAKPSEVKHNSDKNDAKNSSVTLDVPIERNRNLSDPPRSFILVNTSSNAVQNNSFAKRLNTTVPPSDAKSVPQRNDTSLRSRDIYRPKPIPPGASIPHLPRQIPVNVVHGNRSATKTGAPETPRPVTKQYVIVTRRTTTPQPSTTSSTTTSTSTLPPPTTTTEASSKLTTTVEPVPNHDVPSESPVTGPAVAPINMTELHSPENPQSVQDEISVSESEDAEEPSSSGADSVDPKVEEPLENLTFVPVHDDYEDQFPIYFTTLPTATVPVVDTRPDTEAARVEEHRNTTTPRPGLEWTRVGAGAVDKEVEVVYPEPLGVGTYLLAGLGVLPILLGALVGARFILVHNRKKVLDESEYSSEYNRSPLASVGTPLPTKLPRIPTHVSWGEAEKSGAGAGSGPTITPVAPVTHKWEFSRDKLRLQTLLGQGNFGQVWKAEADDISGHEGLTRLVAVKTVKESANVREREDLLRELGIMQELGSHPNVVTLLGCCTEKEPIYLIMEYVMYGKLLSFLRDHRTRAHYYNFSDAGDALTSRDLTVFAYCVARGMDYISNKSIIHRDLAARNVLVDHNKLCKIADFGMSRNVRDTGQIYEQRQSKGALPIRWMAPESLHFSLFTHKTDVWSFGILMWEIVTLGSTPYATMGAREVMRRVRDGYRLDRPSHCRPELFRVITQCWHSEPSKRPTFAELKVELGQLLSDSELNGSYVDLDSYADEMRRDTLHRHH